MTQSGDGATVNPHAEKADTCWILDKDGNLKDSRHHFHWLWKNGHITDQVECSSCGEIRIRNRDSDTIISRGKHDPVQQ